MNSAFDQVRELVRCPRCASRLISATDALLCNDELLIDRRCPECDHRDQVATTSYAAAVWGRREMRLAGTLEALADALADGLAVDLSEIR